MLVNMEQDSSGQGMDQVFNPNMKGTAKLSWQAQPIVAPSHQTLEFQLAEVVTPRSGEAKISDFVRDIRSPKPTAQNPNMLIWGDNYLVMQALINKGYAGTIDLIYIDPPFNTGEIFNFNNQVSVGSEQYEKYLTMIERLAYIDCWERGIDSFLDMMYPRLKLMERLLSPRGSIFLHCDENASHYLKVLMDEVFRGDSFVNEIIWPCSKARSSISRKFKSAHHSILFYSKSPDYYFEVQWKELSEASKKLYSRGYRLVPLLVSGRRDGETGKPWRGIDPNRIGRSGMHWITEVSKLEEYDRQGLVVWPKRKGGRPNLKYYRDQTQGVPVTDIWDDIEPLSSSSTEFVGYPTQKPKALAKRILTACSKEGYLVADFFCGSGTVAVAAEELRRKWIAVDYSKSAIHITRNRLVQVNANPFAIQNLGNYQRHLLYAHGLDLKSTYRVILNLYGAAPREDLVDVGVMDDRTLVYVSPPDRYLTARGAFDKARELENLDGGSYSTLVVLAWDYELQYDENFSRLSLSKEFDTRLSIASKTIPSEIYRRLRDSTLEELKALSGRIKFYDRPYLKVGRPRVVSDLGEEVLVRLRIERYDPIEIPLPDEKKTELEKLVKGKFELLIEYYAIDWEYDGQSFRSQQQEFSGFGRNRKVVSTIVENKLRKGKKYRILVRLVDIFGNDAEAQSEIDLS